MLDNDPSVPVSPEDVIAEALGVFDDASPVSPEECADTALAALARARFVVVPSDSIERIVGWIERDRREPDKTLCNVASLRRLLLDAEIAAERLAPYRSTED